MNNVIYWDELKDSDKLLYKQGLNQFNFIAGVRYMIGNIVTFKAYCDSDHNAIYRHEISRWTCNLEYFDKVIRDFKMYDLAERR